MKGVLILLCSVALTTLVSSTIVPCVMPGCSCTEPVVICSNLKVLQKLANGASNSSVRDVLIESEDLQYIGDNVLPPNLFSLHIKQVKNFTMSPNALKGSANSLTWLRVVYSKNADFTTALRPLKKLEYFAVSSIRVPKWDLPGLYNIGKTVTTLDVYDIGMKSYPPWISHFNLLQSLSIFFTPLKNMPDNALDGPQKSLTNITFNSNQLTRIPKAVTKLKNLKHLNVWTNNVSNDQELASDLKSFQHTLEHLNVGKNKLTKIPELKFLVKLKKVIFNFNEINDFTSGSLPPSVIELDMLGNKLQRVPKVVLELPVLDSLDLSKNDISLVKKSDFPQNSSLSDLLLSVNPLRDIKADAFANLWLLKRLFISGSGITRLPMAIKSLVNLQDLYMPYCRNLICTCSESSLKDFFILRPNLRVEGKCGVENVKHFFTTLVKNCP